ncbi:hypothetical protein BpHYR1_037495 [Brachionus plicatilis]|uniref:Uncharacterized protein n=1 Tax=Brachionus plicatilis TaxID=10195 RepID=A0A3M7PKA3_BRAPC|nr:hypothetical protein BpHYR1_037495 [Brachionus plicatilis]
MGNVLLFYFIGGIVKFKYKLKKNSSFFDELKLKCRVCCTLLHYFFKKNFWDYPVMLSADNILAKNG